MEDENFEFKLGPEGKKALMFLALVFAVFLLVSQSYRLGQINACEASGAKLMEDGSCWFMEEGQNTCIIASNNQVIPKIPTELT